ncbi:hypothetical protein [Chitinophaga nivalis]|uniref:Bacteriocin n=1 Tax=Chitinophaga nivalis TaxID=2991709 RepID=A0ABT3IMQ1_9BACT|nr:hypothetical protein [Chitinophaga nivalis]MCW3465054.1 hypothetical protein [Chitinophaga nivalis]MCW3485254.1 hypothetical protein [Chitinophaga nivalis]
MQKQTILQQKKLSRTDLASIQGGKMNAGPGGSCSTHRCEEGCGKYGGTSNDCVCYNHTGWCGPYVR